VSIGEALDAGSQGVVSELLAGRRRLNVRQIPALAARFGVDPGALWIDTASRFVAVSQVGRRYPRRRPRNSRRRPLGEEVGARKPESSRREKPVRGLSARAWALDNARTGVT